MFWKNKKTKTTTVFGLEIRYTEYTGLIMALEKASALQDQNRRDYNLLFERQNLILKELGKEYVPEKDTTEPAKLIDKTDWSQLITSCGSADWTLASAGLTPTKPKKKRGRPKKK